VKEAIYAVHAAIDAGVNLFDTAAVYGPYSSEELLAEALGPRRKDVVVVTKVGFDITDDRQVKGRDAGREIMLSQAEKCLQRLNTDYVDLLMLHWHDKKTPIPEIMRTLEDLKAAGKCRHIGICNFTPAMLAECEEHGHLSAVQVGYHMFDRRVEKGILPFCLERGIGFMSYGTLGFGLLTGAIRPGHQFGEYDWRARGKAFGVPLFEPENLEKESRVLDRLKVFAARYGKTVPQLAIAWAIGHPAVTVSLAGIRRPSELLENVQAVGWKLSAAERVEIDRIFEEEGVPTYADSPELQIT
jgi:aryl-alcohol dehydrogenase-like predicted oxidoreductase